VSLSPSHGSAGSSSVRPQPAPPGARTGTRTAGPGGAAARDTHPTRAPAAAAATGTASTTTRAAPADRNRPTDPRRTLLLLLARLAGLALAAAGAELGQPVLDLLAALVQLRGLLCQRGLVTLERERDRRRIVVGQRVQHHVIVGGDV